MSFESRTTLHKQVRPTLGCACFAKSAQNDGRATRRWMESSDVISVSLILSFPHIMPKQRHSILYAKPSSSAHPSLLGRHDSPKASSGSSTASSVNERLQRLRLEQKGSASNSSTAEAPPSQTLHPLVRALLQVPETPPPRPRPGLRVVGGRRLPPGPRAPTSWLVQREREKQKLPKVEVQCKHSEALPGFDPPRSGSLLDLCLKELASDWDFYLEYEQFYLPALLVRYKELLLYYLSRYSPRTLDRQSLDVLFQIEKDVEGATGTEGLVRLDLSTAIGSSLSFRDLKQFCTLPKSADLPTGTVNSTSTDSTSNNNDDVPDSWDESPPLPSTINSLSTSFHTVTHLSLANPGPDITWSSLLSFLPHLPILTHLSLAHWPKPSLSPHSTTAYIDSPSGPVPYGQSNYYSVYDNDWREATSVVRRLAKSALCLQWLDLTGCWPWVRCLRLPGIDWSGAWGALEVVKIGQGWVPDVYAKLSEDEVHAIGHAQYEKMVPGLRDAAAHEWITNLLMGFQIEREVRQSIARSGVDGSEQRDMGARNRRENEGHDRGRNHFGERWEDGATRSWRTPEPIESTSVAVRTRPIRFEKL